MGSRPLACRPLVPAGRSRVVSISDESSIGNHFKIHTWTALPQSAALPTSSGTSYDGGSLGWGRTTDWRWSSAPRVPCHQLAAHPLPPGRGSPSTGRLHACLQARLLSARPQDRRNRRRR
ncbi:unnamed protein product [Urochloa humidicola]